MVVVAWFFFLFCWLFFFFCIYGLVSLTFPAFLVLSYILSIHSVLDLCCLLFIFPSFSATSSPFHCIKQCKVLGLTKLKYSYRVDTFILWSFSSSHDPSPLIPSQVFTQDMVVTSSLGLRSCPLSSTSLLGKGLLTVVHHARNLELGYLLSSFPAGDMRKKC